MAGLGLLRFDNTLLCTSPVQVDQHSELGQGHGVGLHAVVGGGLIARYNQAASADELVGRAALRTRSGRAETSNVDNVVLSAGSAQAGRAVHGQLRQIRQRRRLRQRRDGGGHHGSRPKAAVERRGGLSAARKAAGRLCSDD